VRRSSSPQSRSCRYVPQAPPSGAIRSLQGYGTCNRLPPVDAPPTVAVRGDDEQDAPELCVHADAPDVASESPDQPITGATSIEEVVTHRIHESCDTRVLVRPGYRAAVARIGEKTRARKGSTWAPRGRQVRKPSLEARYGGPRFQP